jgi:hypothetical protein
VQRLLAGEASSGARALRATEAVTRAAFE